MVPAMERERANVFALPPGRGPTNPRLQTLAGRRPNGLKVGMEKAPACDTKSIARHMGSIPARPILFMAGLWVTGGHHVTLRFQ